MSRLIDLSGQTFGQLTVLDRAGRDDTGKTLWRCRCECGRIANVTGLNLRTGNTKSCGCLKRRTGEANPKFKAPDPVNIQRQKRTSAAYRHWRSAVSQRCPVCLNCGAHDVQSHHVLGYSEFPELAHDPKNGVSLCEGCHRSFHSLHGRRSGFGPDSLRAFVQGPGAEVMTAVLLANGIADLEKARHFIDLLIELERKKLGATAPVASKPEGWHACGNVGMEASE